jgi:hypothetical protein
LFSCFPFAGLEFDEAEPVVCLFAGSTLLFNLDLVSATETRIDFSGLGFGANLMNLNL